MRLDDYPERDGKRVWLSQSDENDEVAALIDEAESPEQEIAGVVELDRSTVSRILNAD